MSEPADFVLSSLLAVEGQLIVARRDLKVPGNHFSDVRLRLSSMIRTLERAQRELGVES